MKFKKGDKVIVMVGRDKGKKGEIIKVAPSTRRVVVAGVNIMKKRQKPSMQNPTAILVDVEFPIDSSNVMHLDPKTDLPTKIGYKILPDNSKVRFSKQTGENIEDNNK